jgi:regulation of enolase protein 1 (concanavalin A-like superfamily)
MCFDFGSSGIAMHDASINHSAPDLSSDLAVENSLARRDIPAQSLASLESGPVLNGYFDDIANGYTTLANGMPVLNSLPSAPTAIFLDFDGDTTTGTNSYDVDGNPTNFNAGEQADIAEAWRQIATYFAIFDVNVTTVATSKPKAWLASGNNISGGYSYIGVFPNSKPESFNQSSNVRSRQSGLAHELGHNFGLQHQKEYDLLGNLISEYTDGYDSLHGSIMGVDYARSIHKWFIGHAGSASTLQNDISVIANEIKPYQAAGGDGFRADDFGGTIAMATPLDVDTTSGRQTKSAIVERFNDVDVFSFTSHGGEVEIDVVPDAPSGLDAKLEIRDTAGNLLAAKDDSTNDQSISLILPAGTFYLYVSGHRNYGDVGTYDVTVRSLPTNWSSQDIGGPGLAGYAEYYAVNGTYTVTGSGADIAGTKDEMRFAMQTLTGDGEIIARVTSMTNISDSKGGIEIRETTAGGSKHVALLQSRTNGQTFSVRNTTGGGTTTTGAATQTFAAKWLRLTRAGDVFTGYVSDDGVTWTLKGSTTVSMTSSVLIGLVSTAKDNTKLNVARFQNVSLTGNLGTPAPTYNSLTPPANVSVTRDTGSNLKLTWANGAGETGYRVERSTDGVNFTTVTTTAADVTSYVDPGLFGALRYFYRVRAMNGTGPSAPSSVVSIVNRPNAVTNLKVTSLTQTSTVLNWIDTHGESGYRIERSTDGVTFTQIGTVGTNVPSYTDTGLTGSTQYTYRVIPTSSNGDGETLQVDGWTRLDQVAGLNFVSVASNSIAISWSDITGETSFRIERSTDGITYSTLTTVGAGVTHYTDATVSAVNDFYYRVTGVNSLTESINPSNIIFTATPPTNPLPSPWSSVDVGTVDGTGASSMSSGTFKLVGSGAGIESTADAFHFTYQLLQGDGSITARVATITNTSDTSKVGIMIRESLSAGSKHASVFSRPVNGIVMNLRKSTNGGSTSVVGPNQNAPYWLRLVREANTFTTYTSADGTTWTPLGSDTVSMTSKVFIGLAVTADSTTRMNVGTFNNVVVTGNAKVLNRQVFYNRSSSSVFGDGTGNPAGSIDTTKIAVLSGQTTSSTSYTNSVNGLNGLIVDIDGLINATAQDFQFAVWNGIDSQGFVTSSATPTITVLAGAGVSGSSRVKIEFANGAVKNTWLRVTVLSTTRTDLPENDVFYFGNAVADMMVGNIGSPETVRINSIDIAVVRQNQSPDIDSVGITNIFDLNKDGRVNSIDIALVRQNQNIDGWIRYFAAPIALALDNLVVLNSSSSTPVVEKKATTNLSTLPSLPIATLSMFKALPAFSPNSASTKTVVLASPMSKAVPQIVNKNLPTSVDSFFADYL